MIRYVTYFGEQIIDQIVDLSNEVIDRLVNDFIDYYELDFEDCDMKAIKAYHENEDRRLVLDFSGCIDSGV